MDATSLEIYPLKIAGLSSQLQQYQTLNEMKTEYIEKGKSFSDYIFDLQKDDCPQRDVRYRLLYQIERLEGSSIDTEIELIEYVQPVFNTTSEYLGREIRRYSSIIEPSADELNSPRERSILINDINASYSPGANHNIFESNGGVLDQIKQKYEIKLVIDDQGVIEDSPGGKGYEHSIRWQIKKTAAELGKDFILHEALTPTYTYYWRIRPSNLPVANAPQRFEIRSSEDDNEYFPAYAKTYDFNLPEDIETRAVNILKNEILEYSAQDPYPNHFRQINLNGLIRLYLDQ